MVRDQLPGVVLAVVITLSVENPETLIAAGEKLLVAPVGNPLTLNATVPLKLFTDSTLAVKFAEPGSTMLSELGVAENAKSGTGAVAATTSVTPTVCCKVPVAPLTVTVELPMGVLAVVVTVIVDVPEALRVGGEKLTVAPLGNPVALNVTVPLNPTSGAIPTV
jgi:hypothetical protein